MTSTTEMPGTAEATPEMKPDAKPSPKQGRPSGTKAGSKRKTSRRRVVRHGTKTEGKPAAAKAVERTSCAEPEAAKRAVTFAEARREMLRLICENSAAITQAVIKDALEGKYLPAKFLFEAVGLCEVKGDEVEDSGARETLASLLLQRWQVAAPKSAEPEPAKSTELGPEAKLASEVTAEVTEVAEVTPDTGVAPEAPVES